MSWIKNMLILFSSILIAFILVEISFRSLFYRPIKQVDINHEYGISVDGKGYGSLCDHGWCAPPGVYPNNIKKVKNTSEVIYAVKYTIGDNHLRVTPRIEGDIRPNLLKFYGGSSVFGEGLNDIETVAYYSQLASPDVSAENYGFHGHGVHNAYRLLESQKAVAGSYNLLLTGTYHASRSGCIPNYSSNHPRYELNDGEFKYLGKCADKVDKGWIYDLYKNIDRMNHKINSKVLAAFSDFLKSSRTTYQLSLYQKLIREFYELSLQRGETPIVLYMTDPKRSYLTAGYLRDPMPDYFAAQKIQFIDVSLPDEPAYYLHEFDRHPSALANCVRAKKIIGDLNFIEGSLRCE